MATYQRTVSCDDGRGFKYENKVTTLVALRLYTHSDAFYLANNLNSGEKFDDVVFTYKANEQWNTFFVQLKHKINKNLSLSMLRTKGDFVISKYFESFKKIYNKFRLQSNDVIFQRLPIGARFVLFTNALMHETITQRGLKKIDCGILSTNTKDELNVSFDVDRDVDILGNVLGDPMLREFIGKFYLCTGQASEEDVDKAIEAEVKKIMEMTTNDSQHWPESDLKNIGMKFCAALFSWYTKGKYLTKEDVKNILFDISVASQCGKKNASALKFTPSFCQLITNVLKQDKVVCLESKAENSIMCMALLRQLGLTDEPNKLMELKQLQTTQFKDHLLGIKNPANTTLVIDCDSDILGLKKEELIAFFKHLFQAKPQMQIIFVTVISNQAAITLLTELKIRNRKFNCTLIQLEEESKRNIMSSEVIFQGYKTPLNLLLASPNARIFDDVINMAAMTQLLQGRSVEVGLRPVDQIPYYVPRVLTRFAMIAPTVFTDPNINACFALSGISLEEAIMKLPQGSTQVGSFSENKKYVILEGDEEKLFEELSKKASKPLHWLSKTKKSGQMWSWRQSTTLIGDLTPHIMSGSRYCEYVPTDSVLQIKDQIVVIIAEPGMGKSTLIEHLATETKRRNPETWIISLKLNDYTAEFDNPKFMEDIKVSTRNLIAVAAGIKNDKETSKLNLRLFNQCYNVSGNMIILLDGFDEITPYYTEHGLAVIKVLRETAVSRVWVTARPVLLQLLESATCCFSYSIKPFETKDQINFFKKFWGHQFPQIDALKLDAYIKRVLETIANSFDEKMDQFTGVPLQTRMLAEVFQSSLKTYHETGELVLKDRINGVELFEEFVRIKRGIQMDKANFKVTNARARNEQRMLDKIREEKLIKLALLTLLPLKECARLQPPITQDVVQDLKEMVQQGEENSGIVVSYNGDTPQFIHRTFAEYFVALFFTRNYKSNKNFLTSDTFSSKNFEFVKYFFDRIMCAGSKLHNQILERQLEDLELSKDTVDARDLGKRTALHVAASMADNERAIRLLLQAGADVDAVDEVFELTALQYAIRSRHVANIAALFEHSSVDTLPRNVVPVDRDSLRIAVQGDYLRMFLYLLNNGIYAEESLDELSPQKWLDYEPDQVQTRMTILHLAAAYNSAKILKYLLRRDSRDSKLRLLEAVDSHGRTPLLFAAERGSSDAVLCLVEAGSSAGKGLLELAVDQKNLKLLSMAIEAPSNLTPEEKFGPAIIKLVASKSEWSALALDLLLAICPALVNFKTVNGTPLLRFAMMRNNPLAVRKLCELGADVSDNLLHTAILKGFEAVLDELLKSKRIDVNARNEEGVTPVHLAARCDSAEMVEKLVEAGADIRCVTNDGSDLTHAVGQSCNEAVFFYLLELEFDFRKPNNAGETGLSLLVKNGAISLVRAIDPDYVVKDIKEVEVAPKPVGIVAAVPQPKKQKQPPPPPKKKAKVNPSPVVNPVPVVNTAEDFINIAKTLYAGDLSDLVEKLKNTVIQSTDITNAGPNQPAKKKKRKKKSTVSAPPPVKLESIKPLNATGPQPSMPQQGAKKKVPVQPVQQKKKGSVQPPNLMSVNLGSNAVMQKGPGPDNMKNGMQPSQALLMGLKPNNQQPKINKQNNAAANQQNPKKKKSQQEQNESCNLH